VLAACGREGLYLVRPSGRRIKRLATDLCPTFWEAGPTAF
jgi:hypothetical protein